MKSLALCACLLAGPAIAQYDALVADATTTTGALMAGATEMNPLGWGTIPLRIVIIEYSKTLPAHEAVRVRHLARAAWYGAAANNLPVMLGAAGGPVAALVVGIGIWAGGRDEREFWLLCALERQHWGNPDMPCLYIAPPPAPIRQEQAP